MKPVPNYYTLFDLPEYSNFNMQSDDLMERFSFVLTETPKGRINSAMAKFETGIHMLSNAYIKKRYDYILHFGWITILSNPLKVMYVWYLIAVLMLRTHIELVKREVSDDPQE